MAHAATQHRFTPHTPNEKSNPPPWCPAWLALPCLEVPMPSHKAPESPRAASRKAARKLPREKLVHRLWRAAEAEMTALEARLSALPPDDPAQGEGAKALGLLARLVKDLMALDVAKPAAQAAASGDADDGFDLDSFRAELARKLEALELEEQDRLSQPARPE
jgi:hypothetical protein